MSLKIGKSRTFHKPTDPFLLQYKIFSAEKGYTIPSEERFYAKQGAHYRVEFPEGEGPSVVFVAPGSRRFSKSLFPGERLVRAALILPTQMTSFIDIAFVGSRDPSAVVADFFLRFQTF